MGHPSQLFRSHERPDLGTRDAKAERRDARIIRLTLNERSLMRGTFAGLDYDPRQGRVAQRGLKNGNCSSHVPEITDDQTPTIDMQFGRCLADMVCKMS